MALPRPAAPPRRLRRAGGGDGAVGAGGGGGGGGSGAGRRHAAGVLAVLLAAGRLCPHAAPRSLSLVLPQQLVPLWEPRLLRGLDGHLARGRAAVALRRPSPAAGISAAAAGALPMDTARPDHGTAAAAPPWSWQFRLKRYSVVMGLLLGYAWYYVCRYSLNYVGPALCAQEGLDLRTVGMLTSMGQIAVGFSKMGASVVSADKSPSVCLVLGLALTGAFNCFAAWAPTLFSDVGGLVAVLGVVWTCNGLWQGLGSPSCARVLDNWCRPEERGTFWSVWNTSNNFGGAIAPLLVGFGLSLAGWRGGLWVAGLSALGMSGLVAVLVRDEPSCAEGIAALATPRKAAAATATVSELPSAPSGGAASSGSPAAAGAAASSTASSAATDMASAGTGAEDAKMSGWKLFWDGCLTRQGIPALACANFLIYGIRATFISWFVFYVVQGGQMHAGVAASLLSAFEVGGLCGSLASGPMSDYRMGRQKQGPIVGIRIETALMAVACSLFPAVLSLPFLPANAGPASYLPVLFFAGFGLYVVQSLTALCGLELCPRRAIGVSQGFLGMVAYVGAASTGLPLGILIQGRLGWNAWRGFLIVGCLGIFAVLLPLRTLPSYAQQEGTDAKPLRANEWPRARRVAR